LAAVFLAAGFLAAWTMTVERLETALAMVFCIIIDIVPGCLGVEIYPWPSVNSWDATIEVKPSKIKSLTIKIFFESQSSFITRLKMKRACFLIQACLRNQKHRIFVVDHDEAKMTS
jgi:hypothetical protein